MDRYSSEEETSKVQRLKCDRNLNFTNIQISEEDFQNAKKKDPMSHRIIEKRRRDRMNNCLANLSSLIPSAYLKKGRGRIEKTEIIEMAIRHLQHLQAHACKQTETCELARDLNYRMSKLEQYRLGYQECLSEMMRFLVDLEGMFPNDSLFVRLVDHLQKHSEIVAKGHEEHQMSLGNSCDIEMFESNLKVCDIENSVDLCIVPNNNSNSNNNNHNDHKPNNINNNNLKNGMLIDDHTLDNGGFQEHFDGFCPTVNCLNDSSSTSPASLNFDDNMLHFKHFIESSGKMQPNNDNGIMFKEELQSSHLEDILQNPNFPMTNLKMCNSSQQQQQQHHQQQPEQNVNFETNNHNHHHHENHDHHHSSRSTNSNVNSNSRVEEVYKYKTNIKERFKADLQQSGVNPGEINVILNGFIKKGANGMDYSNDFQQQTCPELHRKPKNYLPDCDNNRRNQVLKIKDRLIKDTQGQFQNISPVLNSCSYASNNSNVMPHGEPELHQSNYVPTSSNPNMVPPSHISNVSISSTNNNNNNSKTLPIFVLHPQGTFYIPMTIDSKHVMSYISKISNLSPTFHSVGINVYYSNVTINLS